MIAVRQAAETDTDSLRELIAELGFHVGDEVIRANLAMLSFQQATPFVAESAGEIVGCVTCNVMPVLHRPTPVGRISMLIVTSAWRSKGVGTTLVQAAVEWLRGKGCGICEVTSNVALVKAHAFYERLGFEKTSVRLVRDV